jgi:cell wall-associated NlpC family hydrolase
MPYFGGGMPNFGGQVPWGGNYGGQVPYYGGAEGPYGNVPPALTGNRLADYAASMNGRHFKPGQTRRCADFVSTMLEQSGTAPPGFQHQVSAAGLRQYGTPVGRGQLQPGDVVFFGNTYRPGHTTHVGIYLGDGRFAHRPTANAPVKIDNLNSRYWSSHYTGANRMAR